MEGTIMSKTQPCPRCGDRMQVSSDPCTSTGAWVIYECVGEFCRFKYKVFECSVGASRPAVAASSRNWRRSRRGRPDAAQR